MSYQKYNNYAQNVARNAATAAAAVAIDKMMSTISKKAISGRHASEPVSNKRKAFGQNMKSRTTKRKKLSNNNRSSGPRVHGKGSKGKLLHLYTRKRKSKGWKYVKPMTVASTVCFNAVLGGAASEGVQGTLTYANMLTQGDIQNSFNSVAWSYNLTVPAAIHIANHQTNYTSLKLGIQSAEQMLHITNQTMGVTHLKIYCLVSKVTKPSYVDPKTDWSTGMGNEQGGNSGPAVITFIGAVPSQSKAFNENWKTYKVWNVDMQAGEQINAKWSMKLDRIIDMEYWTDYQQIRGITTAIMIVQYGQVADTTNNTTVGNISTTPTKIVVGIDTKYRVRILSPFSRIVAQAASAYTTGDAHLYVINEESGLVVDEEAGANEA